MKKVREDSSLIPPVAAMPEAAAAKRARSDKPRGVDVLSHKSASARGHRARYVRSHE